MGGESEGGGEDGRLGFFGVCWTIFFFGVTLVWLVRIISNPVKAFGDNWRGLWEGWKAAIDLVVALAPVLGMAIGVVLALAAATALVALAASIRRLHRPRVFVSYHHPLEAQAKALADALETAGMRPLRVRFQNKPEHDRLLEEIYGMARRADFVVCFPGTVPSFVETEVGVASACGKPIVFILPENNKGLPDTGYRSYPVMSTALAQADGYEKVIAFIRHLWGSPSATWRLLARITPPPVEVLVWALVVLMLPLLVVVIGTMAWSLTYTFANFHDQAFAKAFRNGGLMLLILAMAVSFAVLFVASSPVVAIGYRWTTRWTLQRRINKGDYSYTVFKPLLAGCGLGDLNACFFEIAPPSRHDIAPTAKARGSRKPPGDPAREGEDYDE
jgi:hypothetical protein